jgi:hypothetical protein
MSQAATRCFSAIGTLQIVILVLIVITAEAKPADCVRCVNEDTERCR